MDRGGEGRGREGGAGGGSGGDYGGRIKNSGGAGGGGISVKMVDFAHTRRILDEGKDEGYKFGLYVLISILEKLLA